MKLADKLSDTGYHSSVITTFGIDFDAYENIALSRLTGAGCHNNIVLADQGMLSLTLLNSTPEFAGRLYNCVGIKASGVFHPKIFLQIGKKKGRALVASANLTSPGLAGNLELIGEIPFDPDSDDDATRSTFLSIWKFLLPFLQSMPEVKQQLEWLVRRTPWLARITQPPDASQDTEFEFMGSGATSILSRFTDKVGTDNVERIIIISPYWDDDLSTVKLLQDNLNSPETLLLIDNQRALFPNSKANELKGTTFIDVGPMGDTRFIHAKLLIVETKNADHVLYGSPNCTFAALGTNNSPGVNVEASLYRRFEAKQCQKSLKLSKWLDQTLEVEEIVSFRKEETPDSPDRLVYPGQFEVFRNVLSWHVPESIDATNITIQLIAEDGLPITADLETIRSEKSIVTYRLKTETRPSKARLEKSGKPFSFPAIVSLKDEVQKTLRAAIRKDSSKVERRLERESGPGLWLLDLLEDLENSLLDDSGQLRYQQKQTNRSSEGQPEESYTTLSYQEFVSNRVIHKKASSVSVSTFAGTDIDLVRAFLNRIISIEEDEQLYSVDEDLDFSNVFNPGDDVADAESAIEEGMEADQTGDASHQARDSGVTEIDRKPITRSSQKQIADAIRKFCQLVKNKDKLSPVDLLRLRVVLMVLVATAQPLDPKANRSEHQILPTDDSDVSWIKLTGQVLYTVFGSKHPSFSKLELSHGIEADALPEDLLECFGTFLWTIHAIESLGSLAGDTNKSVKKLKPLIMSLTGIEEMDLSNEKMLEVVASMSARFAEPIGLNATTILESYIAA